MNEPNSPDFGLDRGYGCCDCCNDIRDIVSCVCSLDKEFECVKEALGHGDKHLKDKVLTCIILHEIKRLDDKLDRIIHHLNCPPHKP